MKHHRDHWEPGRLWSLLEMLRIQAEPFMRLTGLLASIAAAVRESDDDANNPVTEEWRKKILDQSPPLLSLMQPMALQMSERSVLALCNKLKHDDQYNMVKLSRDITEIIRRIYDEVSLRYIFCLDSKMNIFWEPAGPLFGDEVSRRFPSLAYEIDEAGKCLALSRSTASAFHSIRSLEGAIGAVSRCLGIPDPTKQSDRSWSKLLGAIDKEIKNKWPNTADRMKGDGHTFEELHATLAALRNPWRNATMHLDQKYTVDEAEAILYAVRSLLQKVANRMDENGRPPA